ncbi:MAG: hypothetical protein KC933_05985 [Myxococcales bacterium]|nr:hypothetical protein [Myxococcales bacterium]
MASGTSKEHRIGVATARLEEAYSRETDRTASMMRLFVEIAEKLQVSRLDELVGLGLALDTDAWLSPEGTWFDNRDGAIGSYGFALLCVVLAGGEPRAREILEARDLALDPGSEMALRAEEMEERLKKHGWSMVPGLDDIQEIMPGTTQ